MSMSRKFLFAFLAILLAACTGGKTTPLPVSTPSPIQMDAEEASVYSALLQKLYSSTSYVIMDTSSTAPGGVADTASTLERVLPDLRSVDPSTATSFRFRNADSHPLRPDMDLGSPYVLLNKATMNQFFNQNQDGWALFYAQYPDATGITTLSRVGFNDALDQALVYVGTMSHYLAGAGYFVLLKKVNEIWSVAQQLMTWIS
jgi:hypothetical protein